MGNNTPEQDDAEQRRDLAVSILKRLQGRGHQAYLVGGCVRDRLLGIAPKDYDVSTSATPPQVVELFPYASLVGAHFGVVLVRQGPGVTVEVATFRSEGAYSDSRRPDQVRFETDPALDARRRDFTINGMFEDPLTGQVLDFVGGQDDVKQGLIRAIGNPVARFTEDSLRLLRAIRFAARLRFQLENRTREAIAQLAPSIHTISAERIRDELVRILTEGGARYGFELLSATGLLREVLPEVEAFHGVQQPPQYHPEGDVWTHVLMMIDRLKGPTPTLAWGVLLHDVGKPPTFRQADRIRFDGHAEVGAEIAKRLLARLKVSKEQADEVVSLVANHMRFKDVRQMRLSTLKRFLRLPNFPEHLELHRLDCQASNGRTDAYEFVRAALAQMDDEELRPVRLLTGKDLIRAGYTPGPAFQPVLQAVETAQLEGEITTYSEAMTLAKTLLKDSCTNRDI